MERCCYSLHFSVSVKYLIIEFSNLFLNMQEIHGIQIQKAQKDIVYFET